MKAINEPKLAADRLTGVFVFGVPRGGTNLFCALMNNHPRVLSLAQSGTKEFLDTTCDEPIQDIRPVINKNESIYKKGGLRKIESEVECIVYDKVHYDRVKKWFYVNRADNLIHAGSFKGIVVIRNPFSILSSMDRFHERYGRPRWQFTRENVAEFLQYYFRPQIVRLRRPNFYGVVLEDFIANIQVRYPEICQRYGLPFENYVTSFKNSFEENGRKFNFSYEEKIVADYSGSYLEGKRIKPKPQRMYFDPEQCIHTLGRGGFNPKQELDLGRIVGDVAERSERHLRLFKQVFSRGMSSADVNYILDNPTLDLNRVRDMDIADISGFHRVVSFLPKLKRSVSGRLRRIMNL